MNMKKFICGLLGLVCAGISIACIISGIRALASPAGDMYGIAVLVSLQYFAGALVALYGSVILLSLSYGTAKRNTLLLTSGFFLLFAAAGLLMGMGTGLALFLWIWKDAGPVDAVICLGEILFAYGAYTFARFLWRAKE